MNSKKIHDYKINLIDINFDIDDINIITERGIKGNVEDVVDDVNVPVVIKVEDVYPIRIKEKEINFTN